MLFYYFFSTIKNTIIILTSNLGSNFLLDGQKNKALEVLKKNFKPEFLNRLDDIIFFDKLTKKDIHLIVKKELQDFKNRLVEKEICLEFSDKIISYFAINGYNHEYGARPLKRLIEKKLGTFIADEVIKNNIKKQSSIFLDIKGNNFTYN